MAAKGRDNFLKLPSVDGYTGGDGGDGLSPSRPKAKSVPNILPDLREGRRQSNVSNPSGDDRSLRRSSDGKTPRATSKLRAKRDSLPRIVNEKTASRLVPSFARFSRRLAFARKLLKSFHPMENPADSKQKVI